VFIGTNHDVVSMKETTQDDDKGIEKNCYLPNIKVFFMTNNFFCYRSSWYSIF